MKRGSFLAICLVLVLSLGIACASPAPAPAPEVTEPIEIQWVSVTPMTSVLTQAVNDEFFEKLNEASNGQLKVTWKGGSDVIGAFDQGSACQQGVVDAFFGILGFYEAIAPGIGAAMLTTLSPAEERAMGVYDYIDELHNKGGLKYLGRGAPSQRDWFQLVLSKKVETQEDFSGLKLGTATAALAAVEAWGATPVSMGMDEYYSGMERGLVDGISTTDVMTYVNLGMEEVIKYAVDHQYYKCTLTLVMNLDKWNSLPKHLQDVITETMTEAEKNIEVSMDGNIDNARQELTDAGVEFYTLSPDVADWFINTAYDSAWAKAEENFPEETQTLRELMTK